MAYKQTTALDMTGMEIQNVRAQSIAGAPSTPVAGQFWYDSTTGKFTFRGASSNIDPTARANHTGTQLSATISDLTATVLAFRLDQFAVPTAAVNMNSQKITSLGAPTLATDAARKSEVDAVTTSIPTFRLDQFAAPTAAVNMNNQRITSLATPTASTDACTKGYVDNAINGTDWKSSVRALATTNITLSGTQTVDGVALVAGDRCGVVGQTTATQNGIYVVAAGAWTRAADFDVGTATADSCFFVEEGTTNADTQWRLTTNSPITINTTSLTFAQIGAAVSYTAGTGLSLAGNTFSVDSTVVVKKASSLIGDGSSLSLAFAHNLNTLDVTIGVYEVATGAEVGCDKVRTNVNTVTLSFGVAPTANQYKVVVHG